jgi:hypothetical protein
MKNEELEGPRRKTFTVFLDGRRKAAGMKGWAPKSSRSASLLQLVFDRPNRAGDFLDGPTSPLFFIVKDISAR